MTAEERGSQHRAAYGGAQLKCQQRVGGSAEGRDAWRRLTRWQHGRGDLDKGKGTKEGNHTKADVVNLLPVKMFYCKA